MPAPKSVVLVTVDCLRADHCSFMGYGRPTTPFLDQLAGESFVFPAAIAVGVPTYYSVPAILASRYPLAFGREIIGLACEEQNLASVFKSAGYTTAFFGAANPYLSARFGYDSGFDTFEDFLEDGPDSKSTPPSSARRAGWTRDLNQILSKISHNLGPMGGLYDELYFHYCQRWAASVPKSLDALRRFPSADVIVDRAALWLASVGEKPCFLWLHLMDPHSPYYPKAEAQQLLGGKTMSPSQAQYLNASWNRSDLQPGALRKNREQVIMLYDSAVRWVDAQIARLVEIIRQSGRWENCIFVLTADHGEELLDHGGRYHAPSSLTEELIHVPLLLRAGGVKSRGLSATPFSLLHLAPTLLEAAGVPACEDFQGKSHWREICEGRTWDEPALAECISGCTNPFRAELRLGHRIIAVREKKYKMVLNFDTQGGELFDLEADPAERSPLPKDAAKAERRRLLQLALQHLSKSRRHRSEIYLRTRLREMGPVLSRSRQPMASNVATRM